MAAWGSRKTDVAKAEHEGVEDELVSVVMLLWDNCVVWRACVVFGPLSYVIVLFFSTAAWEKCVVWCMGLLRVRMLPT